MTRRFVCLHGHFYQPPRENPWLEEVEVQDSAHPFHDWNERIAAECYGPNAAARIKTAADRICDIVNNYDHLSFNFGPTLLAWLERFRPDVYRSILEADARSVQRCGHGNALAQAFSHPILPLCSPRDRRTQVRWGLADFRRRFGRPAEGFWLPETAVDTDTLRDLAREGIRFTILSPYQARRVRPPGGPWQDALGARFDPSRPYRVDLGEGLDLAVFFYDGPIARSFAFGDGLASGEEMVRRIESGFEPARGHDELLTIAIDGETFGHHKKGADEALAVGLRLIQARPDLELVNLGRALELFAPEWEVEIAEGSSWSCAHGLERWKSDCGCHVGGSPGWHQRWRAPLREALDALRGHLGAIFEREGRALFADPWAVRDEYVDLILDPERRAAEAWVSSRAERTLDEAEAVRALRLLEMQRNALLMYTSCGWFFAEISGLETVQILKYAARAIQLAQEVTGVDLEPLFVDALARAPSNVGEMRDGAHVYEVCVKPSVVPLENVAAHYAIAGLFAEFPKSGRLFCYRYRLQSQRRETVGPATLAVGSLELESVLTLEKLETSFCVLHFGGSDFRCGLMPFHEPAQHAEVERLLFDRLGQLSLAQVVRAIDRVFVGRDYGLRDLFLDERRRMASLLLRDAMRRYESNYVAIFEQNRRLMEFLREIDSPIPTPLRVAADEALSARLRQLLTALAESRGDRAALHNELLSLSRLAKRLGARLDLAAIRPQLEGLVAQRLEALGQGGEGDAVFELVEVIDLAQRMGLPLDLAPAQNYIWALAGKPGALTLSRDAIERLAKKLWFDPPTLEARMRRPALQAKAPAA